MTTTVETTRVDKYFRAPMSRSPIPADQETIHLRPAAWLAAQVGLLALASRRGGKAGAAADLAAKAAGQPDAAPYLIDAALAWAAAQGDKEAAGERWAIAKLMHTMQSDADPIAAAPLPEQPDTCQHGVSYSADCADCED